MPALEGKVALVTGGGSGLGRACSQLFAREGAKVVIADIRPEGGHETVDLIRQAGGEAVFVQADISNSEQVQAMVRAAVETYGGLDCAVNNAVYFYNRRPLAEIPDADWERAAAVNYTGAFLCMKYEIQAMVARGGGSIVNIGSGNEFSSKPGLSWYLSAKQAIYGMTKIAALDYSDKGIRVNAVGPGSMWTPALRRTAEFEPNHVEQLRSGIPVGRLAEPEEVAEAVVWLCSDKASYVQGVTLSVNGGATLG
jgi:NAD(P)-dependent dehydrogenase (short-subunit alcohol dehydrogenase family)